MRNVIGVGALAFVISVALALRVTLAQFSEKDIQNVKGAGFVKVVVGVLCSLTCPSSACNFFLTATSDLVVPMYLKKSLTNFF